jgi:hypothetical protein
VDTTPKALADWFEERCRERFPLVLSDVMGLRDDTPVLVDGPHALPELVAPLIPSPEHVLYVVASREMQERLVRARGSGVASQVRDPERALANRLGRDEELVRRLRAGAAEHRLPLVEVADVTETLTTVTRHFEPLLAGWIEAPRGDMAARRVTRTTRGYVNGVSTSTRSGRSRPASSTSPASARRLAASSL